MEQKGRCKHGEFNLLAGCEKCVEEFRQSKTSKQIVKVRFLTIKVDMNTRVETPEYSGREYTYYSVDRLNVGDVVMVPVRDTIGKAQVTAVDVPEAEIVAFKDRVKTIPAGSRVMPTNLDPELTSISFAFSDLAKIQRVNAHLEAERILRENSIEGQERAKEELRAEIERDINQSDGTVSAESRIDDKVAELDAIEQNRGYVLVAQEFPTAVVRIEPGKDSMVQQLLGEIMRIKEWADKLVVGTEAQAKAATNDLSIMARLKKAVEEKRQEYVGPLNAHVKAVNDAFKFLTGPLGEADKTARDKVTGYKVEQDRLRREAEETNRLAAEVARRQAAASGTGEFTVDVTPIVVPETPRLTRTEQGTSGLVDNWLYEVVDMALLPDAYKIPDTAMLTAIAKKHHDTKQVPGVRFYNKPGLRVSSK